MLGVVISAIMGWSIWNMKIMLQRLPQQRNWLERRIFWWGRLRGSLDTEAYLEEQLQGTSSEFHKEYLHQMMFHHATATDKSEHDHALCQCRWEPLAEWNVEAEHQPTAVELTWPDFLQGGHCGPLLQCLSAVAARRGHVKIRRWGCIFAKTSWTLFRESLWHRWPSALPGAEPSQSPTNIPRLDPQAKFNTWNHANYEWFMGIKWDSCEETLAMGQGCPPMGIGSHSTVGRNDGELELIPQPWMHWQLPVLWKPLAF